MVRGDASVAAPDLLKVLERAESLRRAGPEGPEGALKEPSQLPRETSGQVQAAAGVPAPQPTVPVASGGGL